MNKKTDHIFRGAATALVTPFKNGSVNYDEFGKLIEFQIGGGIDALVVCATTGESPTLDDREHRRMIEYAVKAVGGRVPLIAGTGSNNTAHAIEMSRAAQYSGADAILCVTPYYNRATEDGLIRSFTAIADAVEIPMILYNVPSRTTVSVSATVYRALADHPNIRAVKEASGDVGAMAQLYAECGGRLDIYSGNDDMIVPAMSVGALGTISVLSNIMPTAVSQMCRAWFAGDTAEAARLQIKYLPLIRALFSEVNPIPVKTALAEMGFDTAEMRLPLCDMSAVNRAVLVAEMARVGLGHSPLSASTDL